MIEIIELKRLKVIKPICVKIQYSGSASSWAVKAQCVDLWPCFFSDTVDGALAGLCTSIGHAWTDTKSKGEENRILHNTLKQYLREP